MRTMLSAKETPVASVHAHQVIQLIRESHMSTAAIFEAAARRFGVGVVFHTCSGQVMSLPKLLETFLARGKLILEDGRLIVNERKGCSHG